MKNSMVEKNKCFVSAVAYVHDCTNGQVYDFCDKVVRKLSDNFENNEIIFVCDGHGEVSESSINDILKQLNLNVMAETVQMAYYQGMEAAMCAGDDFAIGDFIFEFDSIIVDYDTSLVIDVFNRAREGYDIVSAGDDKMNITSRLFYKLINFRNPYEVRHESFRVVSRRAINRIKILNNTIPYRKMLYAACGLPSDHIKYDPIKGVKSRKHNNNEAAYRLNSGINYTIIFTKLMENITYIMSCIFLLVSVGTGIWALYSYFVEDNVVGGWVSLMGVISFGFFGIFLLLSVIVKYMSLILDNNYKKTAYVVESANKNLR